MARAKPFQEFLRRYGDKGGQWYLDIQFGRISFASDTIAATITTRVSASCDTFIVEL